MRVAGLDVPLLLRASGRGGVAAAALGALDADLTAVGPVAAVRVEVVWWTVGPLPPVALAGGGGRRRRPASCSRAAGLAAARGGGVAAAAASRTRRRTATVGAA